MGPILGGLIGAGIGTATSGLGKLMDWGMGQLTTEDQVDAARELRRTAYQDMVWSLKKAGLNPALAFGAQPSTAMPAAIQTGQVGSGADMVSAMASAKQASTAEGLAPSQRELNSAKAAEGRESAINTIVQRGQLLQGVERGRAEIAEILQRARTGAAQATLYEAEARKAGASEGEIRARTNEIMQYGLPGQSWEGLLRHWITKDLNQLPTASQLFNSTKDVGDWQDLGLDQEAIRGAYDWAKEEGLPWARDMWKTFTGGYKP